MTMPRCLRRVRAELVRQPTGTRVQRRRRLGDDLSAWPPCCAPSRVWPGAPDVSRTRAPRRESCGASSRASFSQPAVDLVAEGGRRRWTSSRDLADTLEEIGVMAVVHRGGARRGHRSALRRDVHRARLVEENVELRSALTDPAARRGPAEQILANLLDGRRRPPTITLAQSVSGSYRSPGRAGGLRDDRSLVQASGSPGCTSRRSSARASRCGCSRRLRQYGREVT